MFLWWKNYEQIVTGSQLWPGCGWFEDEMCLIFASKFLNLWWWSHQYKPLVETTSILSLLPEYFIYHFSSALVKVDCLELWMFHPGLVNRSRKVKGLSSPEHRQKQALCWSAAYIRFTSRLHHGHIQRYVSRREPFRITSTWKYFSFLDLAVIFIWIIFLYLFDGW